MSRRVAARRVPRSRLAIGIGGIVVSLLITYGVFTKRIPFVHGYRMTGVFQSSNQLIPGAPVRIAGVTIGKVTGIEDGPGSTTRVKMEIEDSALPIHSDARLRIRPRLFLEGGFAVEVRPGSPSAAELPDGGTIPLAQTAVPVQFHQILGAFPRPVRESFQGLLKELDTALADGGAKALGATSEPLAPLLRDVARVAEAARGARPHDASETIANGARIARALASRERELSELVTALNVTTTALASRDRRLGESLREIDRTLIEAPPQLEVIDASFPAVERFVDALRPSLRAAPPVLDHTVATLDELDGLVGRRELPALVDALGPAVKRLPSLSRRLGALFPLVTPVTDCVHEKALPVLLAEAPDANLSSGRPIWQDLAHATVGLASSAQNFDGNGFGIRYLAGASEQAFSTGSVPGLGQLTGTVDSEILGARPVWLGPGVKNPIRPDAPCAEQPLVDLSQRTGPIAVGSHRAIANRRRPFSVKRLKRSLRRLERASR